MAGSVSARLWLPWAKCFLRVAAASDFSFDAAAALPAFWYYAALVSWQAAGVPPWGPPRKGMAATVALGRTLILIMLEDGNDNSLQESRASNANNGNELHGLLTIDFLMTTFDRKKQPLYPSPYRLSFIFRCRTLSLSYPTPRLDGSCVSSRSFDKGLTHSQRRNPDECRVRCYLYKATISFQINNSEALLTRSQEFLINPVQRCLYVWKIEFHHLIQSYLGDDTLKTPAV